jgi:hypothetical protein
VQQKEAGWELLKLRQILKETLAKAIHPTILEPMQAIITK